MKYTRTLDHENFGAIKELLLGRKVVRVQGAILVLDDGTRLKFEGNSGGCSCSAGDYELTELNHVDNIITDVEFVYNPDDDGRYEQGVYQIFVYADNQRLNLATFEGSDGNGYYGTGYTIRVMREED